MDLPSSDLPYILTLLSNNMRYRTTSTYSVQTTLVNSKYPAVKQPVICERERHGRNNTTSTGNMIDKANRGGKILLQHGLEILKLHAYKPLNFGIANGIDTLNSMRSANPRKHHWRRLQKVKSRRRR